MTSCSVALADRSYRVHIGEGAINLVRSEISKLSGVSSVVVVCDRTLGRLHARTVMAALATPATLVEVEPGEQSKSIQETARIYDQFAAARIERGGVVIALGGGVIGDLAGFVAGTWMRGIRLIQLPTTLEAVIDASIGGKTAINHSSGKNLIGVFHQPSAVIVDTDFLATLPARDLTAGLAESVKHGVVRDPEFFNWHERQTPAIQAIIDACPPAAPETGQSASLPHRDVLEELIAHNCRIKADVVMEDEREAGVRAILNYGHTIGHALEHLCDYELRHGECVALGILVENEIARRRGLLSAESAQRIAGLLAGMRLPTMLAPNLVTRCKPSAVIDGCRSDKKNAAGRIGFVLVSEIGEVNRVDDVPDAEIAAAMSVLSAQ